MSARHTIERVETATARCALYADAPSWSGRTAAIGDFECDDAETGAALLRDACRRLRGAGFSSAIGPMNGDTWHRYRLVVEAGDRKPFLLEPANPPYCPNAFEHAGFERVASYVSAVDTKLAGKPPLPDSPGIVVRPWRKGAMRDDLALIHAMSNRAFAGNRFFNPIDFEDFHALYEPVLPLVDPDLILFAGTALGDPVGFLFAIPDRLEGPAPSTVILKTYASSQKGVGSLLVDRFYALAREKSYRAVIHALMQDDNISLTQSARRDGGIFRRYALWGRRLTP